jgi:hypothetical protein
MSRPFHPGLAAHGILVGVETVGVVIALAGLRAGGEVFGVGAGLFFVAEGVLQLSSW